MHHFHRSYGKSQFFNFRRVARTLLDLMQLWVDLVLRKEHLKAEATPVARPAKALSDYRDFYRDRKVLVTGGLGLHRINLCRTLADLGAQVLAVDSLLPDYGGNLFNLAGYEDKVRINIADVRGHGMDYLVRGQEVLFNLAGQVSHIDSMTDPFTDLEINCRSQLWILEALRQHNPAAKIVYAGTRQVYGKPRYLPVDEDHLLSPTDVNGINKISGEMYHLVYHSVYGIRACSLRLTNTYGPAPAHPPQPPGLHRLVHAPGHAGRGDPGLRRRAPAARLQLRGRRGGRLPARGSAATPRTARSSTWAAETPVWPCWTWRGSWSRSRAAGSLRLVPFPPERKAIDIGDFYARHGQDPKAALGWEPRVALRDGLARTLAYYREHQEHYL